jgi:hypothetical protein
MQGTLGSIGHFTTYYAVQGFSVRRGHFVTLFVPYQTESDACGKMTELQKDNPQIMYRVNCLRGWQDCKS